MVPTDLLEAGLPQTFNLCKKKKKRLYLQNTIKSSALKQGMPVQKTWSSSIRDHRNLQAEGCQVRLMEGIFLILRAIVKVKSDSEGGYGIPSQEDLGMGDSLTVGVIPLCFLVGEKRRRNFSGTLPTFAVSIPRVCKKSTSSEKSVRMRKLLSKLQPNEIPFEFGSHPCIKPAWTSLKRDDSYMAPQANF